MDARRQTDLHQQQRAWRLAASTDVDTFASLLSRPDLLDCINMKWGQIYFFWLPDNPGMENKSVPFSLDGCGKGDRVEAGDVLVILESMKMEIPSSPRSAAWSVKYGANPAPPSALGSRW